MKPKEVSSNGLSLEQELERRDSWLEDLRIRYKELQSKYEKLVTKATPMKPTNLIIDIGYCPICENIVANEMNYCHNCGQALDWSDEK